MPALAVWTPEDGPLAALAPLGLAASAGTALVVDLDPAGPRYPGPGSLAALHREGPRRPDLVPERAGVAVLRNGGIDSTKVADLLAALVEGWPHVVVRVPDRSVAAAAGLRTVTVRALHPGFLSTRSRGPAVFQRTGWPVRPPGPGPVLPVPSPRAWGALAAGTVPTGDRWVAAWRPVWSLPWR